MGVPGVGIGRGEDADLGALGQVLGYGVGGEGGSGGPGGGGSAATGW